MKKKRKSKKINIHITLTNRWLYTLIAVVIISIIGIGVYAEIDTSRAWHNAEELMIDVDADGSMDKSLQEAVDDGDLINAEELMIDVGGVGKSLQEAVDSGDFGGTTCSSSGTCSQVCIGNDCKSVWPISAEIVASGNPLKSLNTMQTTKSTSFVKLKEVTLAQPGTYRITFTMKCSNCNGYARVYVNGAAVTSDFGTLSAGRYTYLTANVPVSSGDSLSIWVRRTSSYSGTYVELWNMQVSGSYGFPALPSSNVNIIQN